MLTTTGDGSPPWTRRRKSSGNSSDRSKDRALAGLLAGLVQEADGTQGRAMADRDAIGLRGTSPARYGGMPVRSQVDRGAIGLSRRAPSGPLSLEDILRRVAAASSGIDPTTAGLASMVAGSVGSAPTIDIAAALAPYDQAKTSLGDQYQSSVAELARIAQGRDADRGLAQQATQARLRELQANTAARTAEMGATNRTDAAAAAGDLAAQGVDPSYAAASQAATQAGSDQIARALRENVSSEQAAAARSMAALERGDQEQAWAGQQNVAFNRDQALAQIAAARAQAESQLNQAQAGLNADYAQRQVEAQLQAAGLLAEARPDPLGAQQQALEYLSQLPGGGQTFGQRQGVLDELVRYDRERGGTAQADDIFRNVAASSETLDDFMVNLETQLGEIDTQAGAPRNWDRQWFRDLATRYYQPSGIDRNVANTLLMYLTGGGLGPVGPAAAAAQPFGGLRPQRGAY